MYVCHIDILSPLKQFTSFTCLYVNSPFILPVVPQKAPKKIEEIDPKQEITTPEYHIIREPPDGRPEFLVIEINLPGIVSDLVHVCKDLWGVYGMICKKWHGNAVKYVLEFV